MLWLLLSFLFFFFNDTATTEIYTLSLHDALPISMRKPWVSLLSGVSVKSGVVLSAASKSTVTEWNAPHPTYRSEEHTSELQSQSNLVCRLLLEKKKKLNTPTLNAPKPCAYLEPLI